MLINGDARRIPLADKSCQMCATSPPYWGLRNYSIGVDKGELGLEPDPETYVANMVAVFREVWRVLRDDGVVWLNLGDSYAQASSRAAQSNDNHEYSHTDKSFRSGRYSGGVNIKAPRGLKSKDLCMIPARVALALQADGWWIRSAPPWLKRNPMPESCTDRPTTAHETIFLLTKSKNYWYDGDAVRKRTGTEATWEEYLAADGHNMPSGTLAEGINVGFGAKRSSFTHPAGRNRRTTDWWYESLDIAINETAVQLAHMKDIRDNGGMLCDEDGLPVGFMVNTHGYPGAHFATFPPKLVEPMILAGSSEKGKCPECGSPWRRVVEVTGYDRQRWAPGEDQYHTQAKGKHGTTSAFTTGDVAVKETTGWEPSCSCGHEDTVPCVILDPFCGSGTVAVVAKRLGRKSVCLDLSMEYLHMARDRTGAKALAEWENGAQAGDADLTGLPMFEEGFYANGAV